jgi:hypothetical protein
LVENIYFNLDVTIKVFIPTDLSRISLLANVLKQLISSYAILSIMAHSIKTFNITTLSIRTFSITMNKCNTQQNDTHNGRALLLC